MSGTELGSAASAGGVVTQEASDFTALLSKEFKPKTDHARAAVEAAVQTLAQQALANTTLISGVSLRTIEGIIAAIDAKLTEQINVIIHQP